MKNILYFILLFASILVFILFVIFYQASKECKMMYDFEITKIEVNEKGFLTFYHGKEKHFFSNYLFRESELIYKGDRIHKDSCSATLYIYRKNEYTGAYEFFLKKEPNGIYPIDWLCDY